MVECMVRPPPPLLNPSLREAVDTAAIQIQQIDLAIEPFGKRTHLQATLHQQYRAALRIGDIKTPHLAAAVIGVEISPHECSHGVAAIDITTSDGTAIVVTVFGNRFDQPFRVALAVA